MKLVAAILAACITATCCDPAFGQAYPDPSMGSGSAHYVGPDLGGTSVASNWRVGLSLILFGAPTAVAGTDAPWIARLVASSRPAKERPVKESARFEKSLAGLARR